MHLALLSAALALALSGVRAQQLPPTFTPCITNCLEQAITQDLNSCSTPGVQCLCANAKTQQDVSSCLQQQCTMQDVGAVQAIVAAECAPAADSTSKHSEALSWSLPWSLSVHTGRSSGAYTWGKTSARFSTTTDTVPSTHLSSTTAASAFATSLANSTSLTSTNSATPAALSSSAPSSDASNTTASAALAGTNAAARVGQGVISMYAILGAVFGLGGAVIW